MLLISVERTFFALSKIASGKQHYFNLAPSRYHQSHYPFVPSTSFDAGDHQPMTALHYS
jgi:hypothetical protein